MEHQSERRYYLRNFFEAMCEAHRILAKGNLVIHATRKQVEAACDAHRQSESGNTTTPAHQVPLDNHVHHGFNMHFLVCDWVQEDSPSVPESPSVPSATLTTKCETSPPPLLFPPSKAPKFTKELFSPFGHASEQRCEVKKTALLRRRRKPKAGDTLVGNGLRPLWACTGTQWCVWFSSRHGTSKNSTQPSLDHRGSCEALLIHPNVVGRIPEVPHEAEDAFGHGIDWVHSGMEGVFQ